MLSVVFSYHKNYCHRWPVLPRPPDLALKSETPQRWLRSCRWERCHHCNALSIPVSPETLIKKRTRITWCFLSFRNMPCLIQRVPHGEWHERQLPAAPLFLPLIQEIFKGDLLFFVFNSDKNLWTWLLRAQELLGEASSVKLQLLGDFHPEVATNTHIWKVV